jgi:hypothetical protein
VPWCLCLTLCTCCFAACIFPRTNWGPRMHTNSHEFLHPSVRADSCRFVGEISSSHSVAAPPRQDSMHRLSAARSSINAIRVIRAIRGERVPLLCVRSVCELRSSDVINSPQITRMCADG